MDAKLKAMYEQLITSVVEGTHKTEAGRELCSALMKAKAQSIVAEMSSLPSDDIDDRDIDLNSKLKRRKSIDPDRDDASCDDIEGDDPALDDIEGDGDIVGGDDIEGDDPALDDPALDDIEGDGDIVGGDDIEGDDPALDNFDEPELKPRRR